MFSHLPLSLCFYVETTAFRLNERGSRTDTRAVPGAQDPENQDSPSILLSQAASALVTLYRTQRCTPGIDHKLLPEMEGRYPLPVTC